MVRWLRRGETPLAFVCRVADWRGLHQLVLNEFRSDSEKFGDPGALPHSNRSAGRALHVFRDGSKRPCPIYPRSGCRRLGCNANRGSIISSRSAALHNAVHGLERGIVPGLADHEIAMLATRMVGGCIESVLASCFAW